MTETDISDISNLLHDLATSGMIPMSKVDDYIWLLKMRIALMEIEFGEHDADHTSPASPSWHFYRPVPGVNQETPV